MNMGISTMRRRPVRTALTTITIILLTFTILTFASFGKKLGISKFYRGTSPPYSGVTLHRTSWGELNPEILDLLEGRWGRSTTVAARYWLNPDLKSGSYEPRNPGVLAYNPRFEPVGCAPGTHRHRRKGTGSSKGFCVGS